VVANGARFGSLIVIHDNVSLIDPAVWLGDQYGINRRIVYAFIATANVLGFLMKASD
jgi:hypothetical protein